MGQGILESNKRWFNQTSCIDKSYLAHYPGQAPPPPTKNPPGKKFLIFWEMELSCSNTKKILIFSQRNAFLIFSQNKYFLIFPKTEPCTF